MSGVSGTALVLLVQLLAVTAANTVMHPTEARMWDWVTDGMVWQDSASAQQTP